MAGGFHIPTYLVERQVSGLQLVHWVRGVWGSRDPEHDPSAAVVKLAAWLLADMADVPGRIRAIEAAGINVADVLGDRVPLSPETGLALHQITNDAIGLHDWTRPYSAAATAPTPGLAADGDDGAEIAPPAPSSPTFPTRGRLGETPAGPLFQCIPGAGAHGEAGYVLIGIGQTWTLDRSQASAAAQALAKALGLQLIEAGA